MKNDKDTLLNFRVSAELAKRLRDASRSLDRPASQLVREAIVEKLEQLAQKHPELQEQAAAAA